MTEPCPFCGRRIVPKIVEFGAKMCPRCGGRWFESGWGAGSRGGGGGTGGGEETIAV